MKWLSRLLLLLYCLVPGGYSYLHAQLHRDDIDHAPANAFRAEFTASVSLQQESFTPFIRLAHPDPHKDKIETADNEDENEDEESSARKLQGLQGLSALLLYAPAGECSGGDPSLLYGRPFSCPLLHRYILFRAIRI